GQSESKGGALTQAAVAAAAAALKPQLEAGSKGQAPALPAKAASTVSDELAEATAASKIAVTK
ncbi:MAG TPA: TEK signal peptide protein, partial [Pseudomonadota bacterium]|nr:TEK signal peptide protein [Pseudomonadota bacterium]